MFLLLSAAITFAGFFILGAAMDVFSLYTPWRSSFLLQLLKNAGMFILATVLSVPGVVVMALGVSGIGADFLIRFICNSCVAGL